MLVEVGGTVGDIESQPFLEAISAGIHPAQGKLNPLEILLPRQVDLDR